MRNTTPFFAGFHRFLFGRAQRSAQHQLRAQALAPDGGLVDDFRIVRGERSIHVLNAPSPAATASLAIGDRINQIATEYFKLKT
jgi:L-2-hydroxyglutarate oxidase LhgO